MTVWIYTDTSKEGGDIDHLKVFASEEAAERWYAEHDPEGVAFAMMCSVSPESRPDVRPSRETKEAAN